MRIALIAIVSLTLFAAMPVSAQKSGLSPLPDFQMEWTSSDLAPLKKIVGNAHWVGLGESVHTTEGYSQAKFRIIRYMVEELGFRALAFESGTGWRDAEKTAKYVETCEGSAKDALNGLADTWKGQSVADMLQWLCHYNQSHPRDPVKFFSFDIQFQSEKDLTAIENGLNDLAPELAKSYMSNLSTCFGYGLDKEGYKKVLKTKGATASDEEARACNQGLDQLEKLISSRSKGSPSAAWKWLEVARVGLSGFENLVHLGGGRNEPRDLAMAAELDLIHQLVAPQAKTIVWAHSIHLSKKGSTVRNMECLITAPWDSSTSMGQVFARRHGNDYRPIALTGYKVSARNFLKPPPWPVVDLPSPTNSDSVEFKLHNLNMGNLVLDLRENFLVPGQTYTIQDTGCEDPMIPSQQFRAMIYLENVEAMQHPI